MDILGVLRQEQEKLQKHLRAVEEAIAALDSGDQTSLRVSGRKTTAGSRTMSSEARAKISKATKARWAAYRAAKAKKAK